MSEVTFPFASLLKAIYCNMKQTPYYEETPVRPDLLLEDLVAIFHPELVRADYHGRYYQLLKE